ncbi:hypothetical protein VitviT2T_008620 [Vitis vinifera]|uniref:Uncharacterized protein n=1 Tax=Vitis vinifera TaxID=29760 RepID=A0ABY9C2D6_VITVI|nr:hypothetical protein VitviT2T_008620 [Vitis vinifera]
MPRIFATLLGAALGVGAESLAALSGETGEPMILGFFVFIIAVAVTFVRSFSEVKARCDHELMIFMLTFSLESVCAYRDEGLLVLAYERLSTIMIGCIISVVVCIFICPLWVGEDLRRLSAANLEKLGSFLEGMLNKIMAFFCKHGDNINHLLLLSIISLIFLRGSEVNLARWEPGYGQLQFCHPWKQYLKIGTLTRQCAYKIEILSSHLTFEIQAPQEFQCKIQELCTEMTQQSGKALKELAAAIRTMTQPSSRDSHIENSKAATKNLKSLLKTGLWEDSTSRDNTNCCCCFNCDGYCRMH